MYAQVWGHLLKQGPPTMGYTLLENCLPSLPAHNCQSHHCSGTFLPSCENDPRFPSTFSTPILGSTICSRETGVFGGEQYFEGRI